MLHLRARDTTKAVRLELELRHGWNASHWQKLISKVKASLPTTSISLINTSIAFDHSELHRKRIEFPQLDMRRFIQNLPYGALAPTRPIWPTFRSRPGHYSPSTRNLSSSHTRGTGEHAKQAKDINQKGADEQEGQLDKAIGQAKDLQARTPWHRQGSDEPPVKRMRSAGAMTKGWRYFDIVCTR